MKKIWVLTFESTDLISVQKIAQNLSAVYLKLPADQFDVQTFAVNSRGHFKGYQEKILEYKTDPPQAIVIVHHALSTNPFLKALLLLQNQKTQYIFHVVGNFIRYGEEWHSLERLLLNKNVQFVVASQCYYDLIKNFIVPENLSLIPFPVTTKESSTSFKKDKTWRVVYSGRYHAHKNVTRAIELLGQFAHENKEPVEFMLASYFDDFNPTTIDSPHLLGQQFHEYQSAIKKGSSYLSVKFLSFLNEQELSDLYAKSDLFISMSTFLDEDFGFSVGEALLHGTPCVVTSWGGYRDFCRAFPEDCFGLKVDRSDSGFAIDLNHFDSFFKKARNKMFDDRERLREKAMSYFDHKKTEDLILSVLEKKASFGGWNGPLQNFSKELRLTNSSALFDEFYKSFWSDDER